MVLLAHIRSAFALSNATYGSPRMTRELRDDGITIGRHRVARLMRENALKARQRRRFKRTTDRLHAFPVAPNLLNQDFNAAGPNQKWGADISYVWTREGWLYLAVVIDLFARRVVGWVAGDRLHKNWRCWPYAGPSPCGVHPPGSFTTPTVAANIAPSSTRLS
jgi:putative transposase